MAIRNDLGIDGQVPMAVEAAYAGILPPAPPAAPNDPANVRQVAQNTASTPPVVITIALEYGNIARLPADTDISNVRANGADLEFVQPDGTVIVVPGGSIANLVLFVGDIQIPAETVELMFETAGIEPAAGPAGGADGAHGGYEDLGPQSVGDGFRQNSLLGDTGLPGAGAQGGDQVAGNTVPKFPAGGIIVTLSEEGLKDANGNDIGNRDGIGIPDDQSDVPQVLNIGFGLVDGEGNDLSYSMLGLPSVNWTSGGNLITWALNAAGTELVGSTIDGEAIVVSFDNTTDSYTVTLLKPLDHPNKAGEDRLELALDIRVRDYQNWNDGKLILRIEDDSPEETANTIRKGQANEDDLDNGIWIPFLGVFGSNGTSPDYLPENNHDGDTSYTGLFGTVPVWGNLRPLISAGADGYGDNGFHLVDDAAALDAWVDQADLASKKSEITTWRSLSTANGEAIGFFAADGRLVFGLYVEPDGTYNFRLFDQIDHAKPPQGTAVEDVIGLDLSGLIAFTDGDGDTKVLSDDRVVIDIIDDIPKARGFELGVVNEDDLANFNPLALLGIFDFWQGSLGTSPYDGPGDGSITGLLGTVPAWGFLGDNIVGGADEWGHFDLINVDAAKDILETLGPNNGFLYSSGCAIDDARSIEIPGIGTAMGFFADGRLVMGLFVDDTGLYNFRLFDQIDHIRYDAQGNEIPVGRLFLDMGEFVTYTDADGDTIDLGGHFKVKVIDDHPLVTCDKIEFTLDEARLDNFNVITAGIQILDALGVTHDLFLELPAWLRVVGSDGTEGSLPSGQGGIGDHLLGTVSKSGFLNELVVGGADEFGRFDVKAFASDADLQAALKSLGGGDYLTSNGEAINNVRTFDLEIGGLDLGTVMGFFSDDGRLIFTVSVSTALGIGAYDIRLFDQMDHFESRQQGEEIKLDLGEFITYTDADLDQVDFGGHITLTVKDDEPDVIGNVDFSLHESSLSNFNPIFAAVWLADRVSEDLGTPLDLFNEIPAYIRWVGSQGTGPASDGLLDGLLGTVSHSGFLNELIFGTNVVDGGADEFGKFGLVSATAAATLLKTVGPDNATAGEFDDYLLSNGYPIDRVEVLDLGVIHESLGSVMGFFAADGRLVFTLTVTEFGGYDFRLFDQIDNQTFNANGDRIELDALDIALGRFITFTDSDGDEINLGPQPNVINDVDHFTITVNDDDAPTVKGSVLIELNEANLHTIEGNPLYVANSVLEASNLLRALYEGLETPYLALIGSSGTGSNAQDPNDIVGSLLGAAIPGTVGRSGAFNQLIPEVFAATADDFGSFGLAAVEAINGTNDDGLLAQTGWKSQGDPIDHVAVLNVPGVGDLMAFLASDGRLVFTLFVNELGLYDVRLFDQIDNAGSAARTLDLGQFVTFTDADGDQIDLGQGHFVLKVGDDCATIDLVEATGPVTSTTGATSNDPVDGQTPIGHIIVAGLGNLFTTTIVAGADEFPYHEQELLGFPIPGSGQPTPTPAVYTLELADPAPIGGNGLTDGATGMPISLSLTSGKIYGTLTGGIDNGKVAFVIEIDPNTGKTDIWQYRVMGDSGLDDLPGTTELPAGFVQIRGTVTDFDGSTNSDTVDLGAHIHFQDTVPDITAIEGTTVAMGWANQVAVGDIFVDYNDDGPAATSPLVISKVPVLQAGWEAVGLGTSEVSVYNGAASVPGNLLYTIRVVDNLADGDAAGDAGYEFTLHKPWPAIAGHPISVASSQFLAGNSGTYSYGSGADTVTFTGINPLNGGFGVGIITGDTVTNPESFAVSFASDMDAASLTFNVTAVGLVNLTWKAYDGLNEVGSGSFTGAFGPGSQTMVVNPALNFDRIVVKDEGLSITQFKSLSGQTADVPAKDQPLTFEFTATDGDGDPDTHSVTVSLEADVPGSVTPGQIKVYAANGTIDYDGNSLTAALAAAGDGDTVYVGAGNYTGNFVIDESITLIGVGEVNLKGTFESSNGIAGDVFSFINTANAYSQAAGTGLRVTSSDVTVRNINIDSYARGIEIAGDVGNITIDHVDVTDTLYGIQKAPTADVTGLVISNTTFTDGFIGIDLEKDDGGANPSNDGRASGVIIRDVTFTDLLTKGIYVETLSNAVISGVTMVHVGFGGAPAVGVTTGSAIELNLKEGTYSNVIIEDFNLTNVGTTANPNSAAISVKVRSDSGTYSPVDWEGGPLIIRDGTISQTSVGIRAGEYGKVVTGPEIAVHNVTISGETIADIDNLTTKEFVIELTDASETMLAAFNATGSIIAHGHGGDDTLHGGKGVDYLDGGTGNDVLWGHDGGDTFAISSAGTANRDTIADYVVGEDEIDLSDLLSNVNSGNASLYLDVVDNGAGVALLRIDETGTGNFAADGSSDVATLSNHGVGTQISIVIDGTEFDIS